jgi:hypothetical protein
MGGVSARPLSAAWASGAGFCALERGAENKTVIAILRIANDLFLNGVLLL